MNIMQRQFGPKTPRGEPRESHRENYHGHQEKSHCERILHLPPTTRGSLGLTVRILMVTKRYLTVRFLMVTKRNLTLKEFYPSSLGDQEKFFGKRILPPPSPTQEHECHAVTNFVFCVWPWDKYFWWMKIFTYPPTKNFSWSLLVIKIFYLEFPQLYKNFYPHLVQV